ncbi:MAG: TatD DNase family protein [Paraglaciecola sp.]|jgi:TatD DNase family protein
MIDSHCHLDFSCFDSDRCEILNTCQASNINTILIPGTQASAWDKQILLCQHCAQLKFSLGLHPFFLADFQEQHLTLLADLLTVHHDQVLAVGEIGLDFAIKVDRKLQQDVLEQQLALAQTHRLPVILHHRHSHNELLRTLKHWPLSRGGVVHAFSGSLQEAQRYIDLGFKLGVGGIITYPRAVKTRDTISKVPLSSLLLETDAPDMPLMGKQGKRNSPENLPLVLQALQELRVESSELVATVCEENFADLFVVTA